jgi:hypothetical protein
MRGGARSGVHASMALTSANWRIGAAITAGYWFLRARCPACRATGDVNLRALDWHRGGP